MFLTTFIKDVENIPGEIAGFFTSHQTQVHSAIADAQSAVSAAIAIAVATTPPGPNGAPSALVTTLGGVSDGLTKVSAAVTSASSATTLGAQAANVAELANALIASGDVGVKNATSQTSLANTVNAVVSKTNTVIGALITAATVIAPTAPVA